MSEELLGIVPVREDLGAVERFKIEKQLYGKFKDDGVKVYLLIDSKKNAEELITEADIAEGKFLEILNFMEKGKMIQLKTIFEIEFNNRFKH